MFDTLRQQLYNTDFIQWLILGFGVTEVLLAKRNSIWLYPAGLVATTLAVYSLFEVQLYAECLLHVYYVVMSVYGWWHWAGRKNDPPPAVAFTTSREWIITAAIAFGGFGVLYWALRLFTPSTVPVWDAWVSATAWAGTWLLARRKVENWLVLNLSNLFAVPLLFHKDLPLFALLTAFLFVIAVFGYIDWRRLATGTNTRAAV